MKTKVYVLLLIALCVAQSNICNSQTLITEAWNHQIGHPTVTTKYVTAATDIENGMFYIVGNIYTTGEQENFFILKMNADDGSVIWQKDYNGYSDSRDFGLDVTTKGDYVYMTGLSWDSSVAQSMITTFKLSAATGDTVWSARYVGGYNGYNAAADLAVDDTGNVFIAGTEQTGMLNFGMITLKYDSNGSQLWAGRYDSTYMYDAAVALALDPGKNLAVTGFSGTGFSSWDFVTVGYDPQTGAQLAYNRYGNGSGNFSQPVGISKDNFDQTYIAGTASHSGQTDIKLIAYDSLLSQMWVHKWGDSTLNEEAAAFENDFNGSFFIGGTQTKANGGKDIVLLKYDKNSGSLIWSSRISATDSTKEASCKAVANDGNGGCYLTGRMSNGSDFDIVTAHIKSDGSLAWRKIFSRGAGTNDDPDDVEYDDNGGIVVTATSMGGDTVYLAVKYEEQPDSLGLGVLIPAVITDHIVYSDFVFEGTVIATNSYFNNDTNYIYTSNTIEVTRVFKGELKCGTVELITKGGTVNDKTLSISHNIELNLGETGIFLAKETSREISAVDFYSESNDQKLYMPYNEQGFIKYYYDGVNRLITEQWGAWDSLAPLYRLLKHSCGGDPISCTGDTTVYRTTNDFNSAMRKNATDSPFPHYTKAQDDYLKSIISDKANRAIHAGSRSVGTLTYNFANQIITGTSVKYLEFDVQLSDDISAGWFDNGLVYILYNTTAFVSDIVTNHKIEVTRGTVLASTADYYDPTPSDDGTGVFYIPLVGSVTPLALYELTSTPVTAVHVKMEIANCNVSGASISMTNLSQMLGVSFYVATPDASGSLLDYDAVDNSSSFSMPDCNPHILNFDPKTINAGVGDSITITGRQFGPTRGNGGVYMKNCDDGGGTDMCLDPSDYLFWSDTLIRVLVPSVVDSLNPFNHKKGGAGNGDISVQTDAGVSANSASLQPLTVSYSVANTNHDFGTARKKYVNNLFDYLGTHGYTFSIDSSISNHSNFKGCVVKAIHDWVCLTAVHFEVGSDVISTSYYGKKDNINMVQFGHVDDSTNTNAQTSVWATGRCDAFQKVGVSEIDIQVNPLFFNQFFADTISTDNLPNNKTDFYEVILHEFGHAHSLQHSNDLSSIMYYGTTPGFKPASQRKITLDNYISCQNGGAYVVAASQNSDFTGCGWAQIELITTCNSVNSIRKTHTANEIKFFPNPTTDDLNIQYTVTGTSTVQIRVLGIAGNLIFESNSIKDAGEQTQVLSTQGWANGFYLINVRINGQSNVAKIIKD